MTKIPKPPSELEETLALHLRSSDLLAGFKVEREFYFSKTRGWRFDFAIPTLKIGVECEGGVWGKGPECPCCNQRPQMRHTRGKGYEEDCLKYSTAAVDGWTVIRVTLGMIQSLTALDLIERAVANRVN